MMLEKYKSKKEAGIILEILEGELNENNPRDWDNLGHMIFFHSRYDLGDEHNLNHDSFTGWDELREYIHKELSGIIILPVRLYDHSGISISCTTNYPYNDKWDSGQIGFIYANKKEVKKEYGNISIKTIKKVKEILLSEITEYDKYLRGEVYGFRMYKESICKCCKQTITEDIDSCFGYIGIDSLKDEFNLNDYELIA